MILVQTFIATGVCNYDSSRFRDAPLDSRKLGWTETWGKDIMDNQPQYDSSKSSSSHSNSNNTQQQQQHKDDCWNVDDASISDMLATKHPQVPITLFQYRPAWLEQLALRMSGLPFIVVNSSFAVNEATGPLPCLRDLQPSQSPVLVGRNHPTSGAAAAQHRRESSSDGAPNTNDNSILEYLQVYRGIDLHSHLHTTGDSRAAKALSKCYTSLIRLELDTILQFLRYEDLDAWQQVYRKQVLRGVPPDSAAAAAAVVATDHDSHPTAWLSTWFGPFQAWSERALARRKLGDYRQSVTVDQAILRAKEAYGALEIQLSEHESSSSSSSSPFLLGTTKPCMVDALLWDHLAHALCDVHLVVVLSSFPRLIRYFQNIYDTYFGVHGASDVDEIWYKWNQVQNQQNQFQQLPVVTASVSRWSSSHNKKKVQFKDAIELMQGISAQRHDLQEVLVVVKDKRQAEPWPPTAGGKGATEKNNFYRWRMGDDFQKTQPSTRGGQGDDAAAAPRENPLRKKLQQEQIHNDQVWISGVVGVSVLAILLWGTFPSAKQ
jgi:hypothetical protein